MPIAIYDRGMIYDRVKPDITDFSVREAIDEALSIHRPGHDFWLLAGLVCGRLSNETRAFPEVNEIIESAPRFDVVACRAALARLRDRL